MQVKVPPVRRERGCGLNIPSVEAVSELREHEVAAYFEPLQLLDKVFEVWLMLDVWSYGAHAKVLVNGDDGACCEIDGAAAWFRIC